MGNLGPGLDLLGLAVDGPVDEVEVRWGGGPGLRVMEPGHPALPTDPGRHAAAIAAAAVLRMADETDARGVELRIRKGLPLSAGQGGSAASAVAGAAAMNALLGSPLTLEAIVLAALEGETRVAGRHAENVAPSALGALVLIRSLDPLQLVPLPVPADLRVVLAHPNQELPTAGGRAALPASVPLATALHQAAQVAGIVAACMAGDFGLLGRSIDDRIAEPVRSPLLPGFVQAKAAALAGSRQLRFGPLERWSHALAGTVVAASGLAILFLGL